MATRMVVSPAGGAAVPLLEAAGAGGGAAAGVAPAGAQAATRTAASVTRRNTWRIGEGDIAPPGYWFSWSSGRHRASTSVPHGRGPFNGRARRVGGQLQRGKC